MQTDIENELKKAHNIVYHKKHNRYYQDGKKSAKETEPLLNPDERVNQAIQKITAGKELNDEQQKWMEYIKEHLKQKKRNGYKLYPFEINGH